MHDEMFDFIKRFYKGEKKFVIEYLNKHGHM